MRVISSCILQTSIHACNQFTYFSNEHTCVQSVRLHACMLACRIHELITRMYARLKNTWTDYTHVCSFAEYMNWLHACMLVCRIHELIARLYASLQNTWTDYTHVCSFEKYVMRVISSCILQTSIHACNQFTYSANEHTCVQSVHVFCKRAYMRVISSCIFQTWTDCTHVCSFSEYMNWLHACMLVCRIHELITRMYARLQNTWIDYTHVLAYFSNEHTCVQSVHVFCKREYMRVISSCILQTSIHACN
jgi:hypothetical protein